MYKLRIEIPTFGPLAPRQLDQKSFDKLKTNIRKKLPIPMCEACKNTAGLIDLHESFTIANNTYKFEGFFLLCRLCHQSLVHNIRPENMSRVMFNNREWTIKYIWKNREFEVFGRFRSFDSFRNHCLQVISETVKFLLVDNINVDYSKCDKYGISSLNLAKLHLEKYNHFENKFRFLLYHQINFDRLDPKMILMDYEILLRDEIQKYSPLIKQFNTLRTKYRREELKQQKEEFISKKAGESLFFKKSGFTEKEIEFLLNF